MARILIIDDETNIRMMLRMALQKQGHVVEQAADGPEGLERYRAGDYDLVLLDQRMPGMEGLEVLRDIRTITPEARVIMITAFGTIDLVVEAMKAGAKDFLRKPFTLETLYGSVESALVGVPVEPAPPHAVPGDAPFSLTTLNGFRIDPLRTPTERKNGQIRQMLMIRSPNGNTTPCDVALSQALVSLVREDTGLAHPQDDEGFWQGLCEEALANFLWQNPHVPYGGVLKVDEYSSGLRRWVIAAAAKLPRQESPTAR